MKGHKSDNAVHSLLFFSLGAFLGPRLALKAMKLSLHIRSELGLLWKRQALPLLLMPYSLSSNW